MPKRLTYNTLERLEVVRPVDRISFIADLCRNKRVLDIGCLDETALMKRDTEHWLHGRISTVASQVVGIDSSDKIPAEGLRTAPNALIVKADGVNPETPELRDGEVEEIVAGEFIEHIEAPLTFIRAMKGRFPGRELVISTPNGVSFANTLLGAIGREVQHPDHLQVFTYKILNTLCRRAGVQDWTIIPYRFYATEMILQSRGPMRIAARFVQGLVRVVERFFPLLCFGYVVRIRL